MHTLKLVNWVISDVERMWNECGTNVERMWNECGTNVERMWNECGTNVERMWNECGTKDHPRSYSFIQTPLRH
jgi:hypothetical protein